jgi:hypothetical protein
MNRSEVFSKKKRSAGGGGHGELVDGWKTMEAR